MTTSACDHLSVIMDQIAHGLILVGPEGDIVFWNPWMDKATERTLAEVRGLTLEQVFGEALDPAVSKAVAEALGSGLSALLSRKLHPAPLPLHTSDGHVTRELMEQTVMIKPVLLPPSRQRHCLIQIQDITHAARREQQLRQQNQRMEELAHRIRDDESYLRAILDNALDGILVVDQAGRVCTCNPAATAIFGQESGGEQEIARFIPSLDAPSLASAVRHREGRGFRYETVGRRHDGSFVALDVTVNGMSREERVMYVLAVRDITPWKEAEAQLKAAKATADAASQAKTQFLTNMSHEIRTPMNAIIGMASLLGEAITDPQQSALLEIITRNGEALLTLINDLLDLNKVEAGQLILERIPFDLAKLASEVMASYQSLPHHQGLAISWRMDEAVAPQRIGDPTRLRQILMNLVSNAIKFTEEGEVTLAVSLDPAGHGIRFQVRDTGIGIPQEKQGTIFELFSQADSATTRKYGGTGLGLAITKRLVELLGGRIQVESAPGVGSDFTVTLPLALDTARAAVATIPVADTVMPAGMRILLAEDSVDNVLLVRAFLRNGQHQLDVAENGLVALEMFRQKRYDLVLMDMQMPEMDGFTATRTLRIWERERGLTRTPVIALTAYAMVEDRERTQQAGCDLHINKPVKKIQLLEAIRRVAATGGDAPHSS